MVVSMSHSMIRVGSKVQPKTMDGAKFKYHRQALLEFYSAIFPAKNQLLVLNDRTLKQRPVWVKPRLKPDPPKITSDYFRNPEVHTRPRLFNWIRQYRMIRANLVGHLPSNVQTFSQSASSLNSSKRISSFLASSLSAGDAPSPSSDDGTYTSSIAVTVCECGGADNVVDMAVRSLGSVVTCHRLILGSIEPKQTDTAIGDDSPRHKIHCLTAQRAPHLGHWHPPLLPRSLQMKKIL